MANTRELIGDQKTVDLLISDNLELLEENETNVLGQYALFNKKNLKKVKFGSVKSAAINSFAQSGITAIENNDLPVLQIVSPSAFQNCNDLISVSLPSVTRIDQYAFMNCGNLEIVETGESRTSINDFGVFNGCIKMKSLIINSTSMSNINSISLFAGCPIQVKEGAIYVPDEIYDRYISNRFWSNFYIAKKSQYPISDFSTITDSWEQIISAENDGTYLEKYHIGDTKKFTIGDNTFYATIIGFDKELKANGEYAHITWMTNKMSEMYYMNNYSSTYGGWGSSALRQHLSNDVLQTIDISNLIVPVQKVYQYSDSGTNIINTSEDKLWIPSYSEIFGKTNNNYDDYNESSPVYTDVFVDSSIRTKYSDTYTAFYWWLRTVANNDEFAYISNGGNGYTSRSNTTIGVIICFCT